MATAMGVSLNSKSTMLMLCEKLMSLSLKKITKISNDQDYNDEDFCELSRKKFKFLQKILIEARRDEARRGEVRGD